MTYKVKIAIQLTDLTPTYRTNKSEINKSFR